MGTASHRKTALLRGLLELVGLRPVVFLSRLIVTHVDAVLLEEPAREAVAAVHKIRPLVQGELLAAADVVRTQKAHAVILGAPVPLQERALRNTRVLDLRLDDLDGSILQVVHDLHVAETAVLVRPLRHRLLEVGVKTQDLPVVLQPGGGEPRVRHVLRHPACAGHDPLLLDVQLRLVPVVWVGRGAQREASLDHRRQLLEALRAEGRQGFLLPQGALRAAHQVVSPGRAQAQEPWHRRRLPQARRHPPRAPGRGPGRGGRRVERSP
mmetsp:Transcript_11041/g.29431  ORF Transcript_11041/g.29431 Transcript_11041/m.29431 type:complete len:267 (-) Transcript_11041:68-868(-)